MLIIDDGGLTPLREQERCDLYEIMEDRLGLRSTIMTSQLPPSKWHDHVGEPTLADAILDRLLSNAHRIVLKGPSRRPSGAKEGNSEMREPASLRSDRDADLGDRHGPSPINSQTSLRSDRHQAIRAIAMERSE